MVSEETYESCSIFKNCGEEERAEALEVYLRSRCSTPRIVEEQVLDILWRWKLEEDTGPDSPPPRKAAVFGNKPKIHTTIPTVSHASFDVFQRSSKASRSSWEPTWIQRANESISTLQHYSFCIVTMAAMSAVAISDSEIGWSNGVPRNNRLQRSVNLHYCLMNVANPLEYYDDIDNSFGEFQPQSSAPICPPNSPMLGSLRVTPMPIYFGPTEMASLFLADGRIRRKRALPAYSDYSLTKPRKKLTIQEARMRAKDIEAENRDIMDRSESVCSPATPSKP